MLRVADSADSSSASSSAPAAPVSAEPPVPDALSRYREIATPAQTSTAVLPPGQEYLEWVNPDGKTRFVCAQSHCRLALKNKQGAQKHVEDKVCHQDHL